jgi:hypothetical protein
MNTRRWVVCVAAVIVGVLVLWLASYPDTYTPPPAGYDVSGNDREITVGFCGSTSDTIEGSTFGEDDRTITVGVRLRVHDGFAHGIAHKITFALRTPIADRVVRDAAGNSVPRGTYVCPS